MSTKTFHSRGPIEISLSAEDIIFETGKDTQAEEKEFQELLKETLSKQTVLEERVVKGLVIAVDEEFVTVDVEMKSEGRIPLKEFGVGEGAKRPEVGDIIDVHVERYEDRAGSVMLSYGKARQEATWQQLTQAFAEKRPVEGVITGRIKGGFIVDLSGATAFLPGSQLDIRPIKDASFLMGIKQPFMIIKMEDQRNNLVVSRRTVMEDSRAEERKNLLANLEQGKHLEGVVKNITDYGAFVDLGGIDGLLHVTDISWRRVKHPSDVLSVGQVVPVVVTRFNRETQRISLGMKQLEKDPWVGVEEKYKIGSRVHGRVTNVTDCGAFVEIEEGLEGLVYVSEMMWGRKGFDSSDVVSEGQEVEVQILDVDPVKRRISLGLKQCTPNPLEEFAKEHPVDSELEAVVKDVTEFGLIVQLNSFIDGTVHRSDLSWTSSADEELSKYHAGDKIRLRVLNIDPKKEIIGLGVKQLSEDLGEQKLGQLKKNDVVTCEVTKIADSGIEVVFAQGALSGFIRRADLSRDREYQNPHKFTIGDKVDAMITAISSETRKVSLSIKACEIDEEKRVMAEYGSSDSGARLGNILGAAMGKANSASGASDSENEKTTKASEKNVSKPKKTKKVESEVDSDSDSDSSSEDSPESSDSVD